MQCIANQESSPSQCPRSSLRHQYDWPWHPDPSSPEVKLIQRAKAAGIPKYSQAEEIKDWEPGARGWLALFGDADSEHPEPGGPR